MDHRICVSLILLILLSQYFKIMSLFPFSWPFMITAASLHVVSLNRPLCCPFGRWSASITNWKSTGGELSSAYLKLVTSLFVLWIISCSCFMISFWCHTCSCNGVLPVFAYLSQNRAAGPVDVHWFKGLTWSNMIVDLLMQFKCRHEAAFCYDISSKWCHLQWWAIPWYVLIIVRKLLDYGVVFRS